MNCFKTVDCDCEAKRPTGEKKVGGAERERESYLSKGSHLTSQQDGADGETFSLSLFVLLLVLDNNKLSYISVCGVVW